MSDTPRTDEQVENWKWALEYPDDLDDVIEFARKLERELADLRDEVKRHVEIASFNAEDSLKWRNLYQNERDNHDATQEKLSEVIKMRDRHEAASKAQNEDITSLKAELAEANRAVAAKIEEEK